MADSGSEFKQTTETVDSFLRPVLKKANITNAKVDVGTEILKRGRSIVCKGADNDAADSDAICSPNSTWIDGSAAQDIDWHCGRDLESLANRTPPTVPRGQSGSGRRHHW